MVDNKINKKSLALDFVLNVFASLALTFVIQFFVFPSIGRAVDEIEFGNILTMIGIMNVIAIMFGSSLNNVLLLFSSKKDMKSTIDNFSRLYIYSVMLVLLVTLASLFFFEVSLLNKLSMIVYTQLLMIRSYEVVFYRIRLNYKVILYHSVITALSYFIGVLFFYQGMFFGSVFVIGEIGSFLYLKLTLNYCPTLEKKSSTYSKHRNDFLHFLMSSAVANLLLYMDRLLINPLLGAANVSIFFTASFFGKILGMVMQPMSGVILSYIARASRESGRRILIWMVSLSFLLSLVFLALSIPITPIFIKFLYPSLYEDSIRFAFLCNCSSILLMSSMFIQPVALRFSPVSWQPKIQITYFSLYMIGGIMGIKFVGLEGFIISSIIANGIKYLLLIVIGLLYTKNDKEVI